MMHKLASFIVKLLKEKITEMTKTAEFSVRIKDGIIKLPSRYKDLANAFVKIVLFKEDNQPKTQKQKIIKMFSDIQQMGIFDSIDDPVEWQKKIRDEWE